MKIAVVTDSTAYLPEHIVEKYSIYTIPLTVTIGTDVYEEEVTLCATDFYDKVRGSGTLPKTSQPPVGKFVELFEQLKAKGYTDVISIHLSSGISGTYNGAIQAGEMVDGLTVHAYDSEIACYVQGFYVIEAARLAQKEIEPTRIITHLDEVKETVDAYFMVDDLSHLQRGGRLSGAAAMIGSLLQVKPLLHFVDTKIVPFEKIRTKKKAYKRMSELLEKQAEKMPIEAVIIHANAEDEARKWKSQLEKQLPNVVFHISHFGPVIGTHLGEGAMGLGWKKRFEE